MKTKSLWSILAILLGIVISCLCITPFLLGSIGSLLVISTPLQPADAIVVLSGGRDLQRLEKAVNLMKEGQAGYLILTKTEDITESGRQTADYLASEAHQRGIPVPKIVITQKTSKNTEQEAIATLEILRERGWKTLIVVTDPYHTLRSRIIFREVMRKDSIKVYTVPSKKPDVPSWLWYIDGNSRRAVWREILSLLAYLLYK
ncbi:YdcF family protein [Anaerolinea thermophila]|uniref:DUF218 domain-containing protein n=1 Tax=Anaerolinea thermophila (strain DSM 14523 / JCM 11388 / NBRC 100420 / UNI-1) TaxID=926569 RepID=E8N5E5_ANATU|nr:YdcF family protein [Anaerolinea thermophila]BAJ63659.1 hypothetical protein ANT_16330 [Anaerolinea thermophila UNI-1]